MSTSPTQADEAYLAQPDHAISDAALDTIFRNARTMRQWQDKPVSPALFAHFVMQTSNLAGMRDWYLAVLNAHVVHENPMLCFMTYDDEHHRVAMINMPALQARDEKARGVHHVAYTYASLSDLLATYRRLKTRSPCRFACSIRALMTCGIPSRASALAAWPFPEQQQHLRRCTRAA